MSPCGILQLPTDVLFLIISLVTQSIAPTKDTIFSRERIAHFRRIHACYVLMPQEFGHGPVARKKGMINWMHDYRACVFGVKACGTLVGDHFMWKALSDEDKTKASGLMKSVAKNKTASVRLMYALMLVSKMDTFNANPKIFSRHLFHLVEWVVPVVMRLVTVLGKNFRAWVDFQPATRVNAQMCTLNVRIFPACSAEQTMLVTFVSGSTADTIMVKVVSILNSGRKKAPQTIEAAVNTLQFAMELHKTASNDSTFLIDPADVQ